MNKYYKIIIWHGVVVVLAWWMWQSGQNLGFNSVTGLNIELPTLFAFLLLTSTVVLGYAMFRMKWNAISAPVIIGFLFLTLYGFTPLNWLGAGVILLLNLDAYRKVGSDVKSRITVNPKGFLRAGLSSVIMAIFIASSFAVYQSEFAHELESANTLPKQTESFLGQIADKFVGSRLDTQNLAERKNIVGQITNQAFQQINQFLKPYFKFAPPLLAFGLFLVLWGLSWIFIWLSVLLGLLIFWILKMTKVVTIGERDIKAEVLVV
jgi:hypothetical protein